MKSSIWVEKYRPRELEDVIFQDERQQKIFMQFKENQDMQHILLTGVQGTGKSTISKALIHDLNVDAGDVMTIKCSSEMIDALRNKVETFAMTFANGPFKVVRLEEFDYLSLPGQALLRSLIEDSSSNCRFIATCNYDNKIMPAIKSRFQEIHFKAPDKEKIALRMADILAKENVDYEVDHLLTYIDVGYPDIRKTIQLLQGNVQDGKLLDPRNAEGSTADWKFKLLEFISSANFKAARKVVCETATREEHEDVFRFLYDNIESLKVKDKEAAILIIAEYLKNHTLVADTEINLAGMFIALSRC